MHEPPQCNKYFSVKKSSPKFTLITSFRRVVVEVPQDTSHSNKKDPSVHWHVTLSCPSILISIVSTSLQRQLHTNTHERPPTHARPKDAAARTYARTHARTARTYARRHRKHERNRTHAERTQERGRRGLKCMQDLPRNLWKFQAYAFDTAKFLGNREKSMDV